MRFLFDTNVLIERCRSTPNPKVKQWVDSLVPFQVVICPIVAAEFLIGAFRMPPGQRAPVVRFLRDAMKAFVWMPVDLKVAVAYGEIRSRLKVRGRANDLWIASIAKAHGLIVATRNERDFKSTGVQTWNPF
jgi:toxin FitB